jgi:hypothetical protein
MTQGMNATEAGGGVGVLDLELSVGKERDGDRSCEQAKHGGSAERINVSANRVKRFAFCRDNLLPPEGGKSR